MWLAADARVGAFVKTHVEFRSEAFPPYESEAEEVNPGRFGKRVAEFFASGLTQEGFLPGAIFAEDWGWVVPKTMKSSRCGSDAVITRNTQTAFFVS